MRTQYADNNLKTIDQMKNLENKKISISLLIFSSLHIFLSYVSRIPNNGYEWKDNGEPKYVNQPISSYDTNLLIFKADLDFTILILTIVFGFSIYCFIFKTDDELKLILEKIKIKITLYSSKIHTPSLIRKLKFKVKDFYGGGNIDEEKEKLKIIESTPEGKKYLALYELKTDVFSKFVILLLIFLIECGIAGINTTAFVLCLILIIIQKIYSANLCNSLSTYNKGTSLFWLLFGFIFPAIALYFASSKITLKTEYKKLYEKYEK